MTALASTNWSAWWRLDENLSSGGFTVDWASK